MTLEARIIAEIQEKGPMSVARYMELALGDPEYGYYMHKDPLGLTGDFVTAPEISQIFGELCGLWLAESWRRQELGRCDLTEFGPGRGTLMADALRATRHVGGFHTQINVQMIETSPTLAAIQQKNLEGRHKAVSWMNRLPDSTMPLLAMANEFFDALPIHQYIETPQGWHERRITTAGKGGGLAFAPEPEGPVREACPLAADIMGRIAGRIAACGGVALVVDYGYDATPDGPAPVGDTLQAVFEHQYHDVLHRPGKADITAHVDFSALAAAAEAAGAQASPVISQREFLRRMGGRQRVEQLLRHAQSESVRQNLLAGYDRLISPEKMGELFRVLAVTPRGIPALLF